MKLFFLNVKKTHEKEQEDEVPPFRSFKSTYKWITRILSIALMYPNPKTDTWRLIAIPIVTASAIPYLLMTTNDMYDFFMEGDLANLIRISTVSGPFASGFIKIVLIHFKRREAETIINEIERDYALQNQASQRTRKAVYKNIRANIFYEKFWTACVFICVSIFPIQAAVMNSYSNIIEGENRYMITDLKKPFAEPKERFSSPFFEIMFGYMFYCCVLYFLHFTGYDAFLLVSIGHACLKFELFTMALEDAMTVQDVGKRRKMLAAVIREQNRTIWYVDLIQNFFSVWLGLIIVAILSQLCCCLFYIMEGFGMDERYSTFTLTTVIYLYVICSRASQLKFVAEDTPTKLYCCGWDSVQDEEFKKILPLMIARFQIPFVIKAFRFFVFDMELFISIVKTAYSMFTLLKE